MTTEPIGSDPLGRLSEDTRSGLATFRVALDDYIAARVESEQARTSLREWPFSDEEIARRLEITKRRLDAAFFIAATASVSERGER